MKTLPFFNALLAGDGSNRRTRPAKATLQN